MSGSELNGSEPNGAARSEPGPSGPAPSGTRTSGRGSSAPTRGWDANRRARAALISACGSASPALADLVRERGAIAVWRALAESTEERPWVRRAAQVDEYRLADLTAAAGARFVVPGDPEWCSRLDDLDQVVWQQMGGAPLGLWLRGPESLDECLGEAVAIVGSRACTSYGQNVAADLAADLALGASGIGSSGRCVLSGGAYGVDVAAHRAALAVGGHTVAVLASGVDRPYPVGHAELFAQIAARSLLVSEVPVGSTPTKQGFLQRNRLIAALAVGVVVVEAGARSGALNTTSWSNALGRVTMAVPGPVTSSLSTGPNRLIWDAQAVLVRDAADVAALVGPQLDGSVADPRPADRPLDLLDPDCVAVHECLPARGGVAVDQLVRSTGLAPGTVMAALDELRDSGLVVLTGDGRWRVDRAG